MKKIACFLILALVLVSFASAEELTDSLALMIHEELVSAVTDNSDAWAKYMLDQPVTVESVTDSGASASVPSWETIDASASAYDVIQSLKTSRVSGNISYSRDVTGNIQIFGVDVFRRNIVSAAAKARESFSGETLSAALSGEIFPAVYAEQGGYTQAFEELRHQYGDKVSPYALEAALTLQRPALLSSGDGPRALRLTLARVNADAVARSAYIAAYDTLKNTDKANAYTREQLSEILQNCFVQSAAAVSEADFTQESETYIDMEKVLAGDTTNQAVVDFAANIDSLLGDKLDTLMIAVSYLPDYPARNQPDTGVLKGPVSGTHTVFKSPDDGYGRIVSLLVPETGQEALKLFMHSGDTVDAYIPSGRYLLEYGKGSEWYGDVKRFGSDAAYAVSIVDIEISQSDKYHIINFVSDSMDGVSGVKLPMRQVEYVEPD